MSEFCRRNENKKINCSIVNLTPFVACLVCRRMFFIRKFVECIIEYFKQEIKIDQLRTQISKVQIHRLFGQYRKTDIITKQEIMKKKYLIIAHMLTLFAGIALYGQTEMVTPSLISLTTGTTFGSPGFELDNLINDSGLSGTPTPANYTSITSTANVGDVWVTTDPNGNPPAVYYDNGVADPVIEITLSVSL